MARTVPLCRVCRKPMMVGQPGTHWGCQPECGQCHYPVDNCHCAASKGKRKRGKQASYADAP